MVQTECLIYLVAGAAGSLILVLLGYWMGASGKKPVANHTQIDIGDGTFVFNGDKMVSYLDDDGDDDESEAWKNN